jgi:hypothetical protein
MEFLIVLLLLSLTAAALIAFAIWHETRDID